MKRADVRRAFSLRFALLSCCFATLGAAAVPDCVAIRTSAPYRGLGYDHIVHIHNGCDAAVQCRITTNVNPDPIDVTVAKGAREDVVTFRGSPARTFEASVHCEEQR